MILDQLLNLSRAGHVRQRNRAQAAARFRHDFGVGHAVHIQKRGVQPVFRADGNHFGDQRGRMQMLAHKGDVRAQAFHKALLRAEHDGFVVGVAHGAVGQVARVDQKRARAAVGKQRAQAVQHVARHVGKGVRFADLTGVQDAFADVAQAILAFQVLVGRFFGHARANDGGGDFFGRADAVDERRACAEAAYRESVQHDILVLGHAEHRAQAVEVLLQRRARRTAQNFFRAFIDTGHKHTSLRASLSAKGGEYAGLFHGDQPRLFHARDGNGAGHQLADVAGQMIDVGGDRDRRLFVNRRGLRNG